jgi:RHS repeat-associated protein
LTDEIGNIVERYRYRVYGEHVVLDELFVEKDCGVDTCYTGNIHNFLWGGSMHEPETDLYWMRNRYYHKGMKRFINQDPIGIWGDANNLGNGFAYVAGMVVEATDPMISSEKTGQSVKPNYTI